MPRSGILRDTPREHRPSRCRVPQRRAFDAVLAVDDSPTGAVDGRTQALGVGFLNALTAISRLQPVFLAIDDVHWVDRPRFVLEFALRPPAPDEDGQTASCVWATRSRVWVRCVCPAVEHERIDLWPVPSLGATHRIVHDRLGASLPRPMLRHLHARCGRQPVLRSRALARVYSTVASSTQLDELPLPKSLQEVAEARIGALGATTIDMLLVAAAAAAPTISLVRTVGGEEALAALDTAAAAGVVETVGERVEFTHPLLAAAVLSRADPRVRQSVHRRLADAVTDPEERARHLAACTSPPDEGVAAALEVAAVAVEVRGAPDQAAQLAELSGALHTPATTQAPSRRRRLFAASDLHGGAPGARRVQPSSSGSSRVSSRRGRSGQRFCSDLRAPIRRRTLLAGSGRWSRPAGLDG